jgi:hypothetical protein
MTANNDPFAAHRIPLRTALQSALDAETYGYAALLQSQMAISAHDDDILMPGLLCLATAEAIGGDATVSLAPAVSLVLLGAMSAVFEAIAGEGASELEREWGMPRALNAGDGFYALANTILLSATKGMGTDDGLQAVGLLDAACHGLSLEIHRGVRESFPLLRAGAALGALFAGADGTFVTELGAPGSHLVPISRSGVHSPEGLRNVLANMATYMNRSRR